MTLQRIDAAWCAAHPLPNLGQGEDKDARGQALVMGGSAFVPGALLLTGEALLRVGAGKVKLATLAQVAIGLGLAFPEAATIALPGDAEGEIAADALPMLDRHLDSCDALVLGPGMMPRPHTADLIAAVMALAGARAPVLLDAGALTSMRGCEAVVRAHPGPVVMTPHHGELAALMGIDKDSVAADPVAAVRNAAAAFGAIVVLKSSETLIADRQGALLGYQSAAPGLGTAGSGDVLAGVIGGLLARGVAPLVAAAWGVWLHGEAGRAASDTIGPIGFLARDLLSPLPRLLATER
ncbi:NAD(P)H-hydrate dehydratase [Sphingomonas sp. PB4P5]|uniref:NAD(P)H-hydrate dehydratase n=1 Tax=Parasphingomonas puruogangriensis TaxID=3096155 RepID=UPI002FC85BED